MFYHGGATSPDSFLKAYKPSETKNSFLYKKFDHPDTPENTKLPSIENFYTKLRTRKSFEAEYNGYVNLSKNGAPAEQPLLNWNYQSHHLLGLKTMNTRNKYGSKNKGAHSYVFLQWFNNKDVLLTLEAMQKMIAFHHDKDMHMFWLYDTKLGHHFST